MLLPFHSIAGAPIYAWREECGQLDKARHSGWLTEEA